MMISKSIHIAANDIFHQFLKPQVDIAWTKIDMKIPPFAGAFTSPAFVERLTLFKILLPHLFRYFSTLFSFLFFFSFLGEGRMVKAS